MKSTTRTIPSLALSLALAVAAAGCGDGTGPAGSGSVQVNMSRSGGSASGDLRVSGSLSGLEARAGLVATSQIESVEVTVNRVEVLRVAGDTAGADTSSAGPGPWVTLQVEGGSQTVDLTDLPSGDGVTVASAELDPGEYRNVRLFFSGATVTFSEDVTFPGGGQGAGPGGQTYKAGTAHELFVPSAEQTGLKVATGSFTVDDGTGATVDVLADTDASVDNIVVTGGQGLIMKPVLTGRARASAGR